MGLRIHRWNDTNNNRLKSNEELSANCLEASEKLSEELSAECLEVSVNCLRVSEYPLQTAKDMFSAGILTPSHILLTLVPVAVVAAAGYLTMKNAEMETQVFLYLVGFGLLFLFDTFHAIGRVLAPQSRLLVAVDLFGYAFGCAKPSPKYFLLVTIWTALSILVISLTNRACICAHNWITSKSIQSAVAKNPESKGYSVWLNSGKNQCRIILSECGLHFGDKILDLYGLPLFLAGYYSAIRKNAKLRRTAEKTQEAVDDLLYSSEDLSACNEMLKQQVDALQEEIDHLKTDKYRLREQLRQKDALLSEFQEEEPEEQTEVFEVPESEDERIKAMLRNGGSIREVAKFLGVSKNKVEQIRKQIKEELSA